jgi:hypothetical protein
MAKTAKRLAKPPPQPKGALRPVLLAAGLALYWFVEYQDPASASDAPVWGYGLALGVRLLADFVAAWVAVSALQLAVALSRLGASYLRGWWLLQAGR